MGLIVTHFHKGYAIFHKNGGVLVKNYPIDLCCF